MLDEVSILDLKLLILNYFKEYNYSLVLGHKTKSKGVMHELK